MGFNTDIITATTISGTTFYGDGSNLTGVSGGGTFTGGTVSGSTQFTNGLTANTISATTISGTTFYGDGSNLTGISVGNLYTYEIGQYVSSEGGVIAHRWISTSSLGSPSGGTVQNYLVLDTTDLSTSTFWSTGTTNISNVESVWDGLTNTNNLISAGEPLGITPTSAAGLCYNSTNNSKTDWYLPSIDEWNLMYNARYNINQSLSQISGAVTFESNNPIYYWSSSEYNSNRAWRFDFRYGAPSYNYVDKNSFFNVRAVRAY
jgi:hypothetical protein